MPVHLRKPLLLFSICVLLANCAKWKLEPYDLIPQAKTGTATSPATTSVQVDCQVERVGPNSIKEFGVIYSSTNPQPTVSDSKVQASGTSGSAQVMLNGLKPNTKYYYRTYAINDKNQIGYGETLTFVTAAVIADVRTLDLVGSPGANSFQVQIQVMNNSEVALKEYGIVYSLTNQVPDVNTDSKVPAPNVTGATVTISVTNLQPNKTYYYRAYAITSTDAVSYGGDTGKSLKTGEPAPSVETLDVVGTPTSTSAQVQSRVTNASLITLKELGVVYSNKNQEPNAGDNIVVKAPASLTSATVSLTGLQPNTDYNYWAFAINGAGTPFYGTKKLFKTANEIPTVSAVNLVSIKPSQLDNNSATVSFKVDKPNVVTEYGFILTPDPNKVDLIKAETASGDRKAVTGAFPTGGVIEFQIKELTENSMYYAIAYAKDATGKTVYSKETAVFQTKYGSRGNWRQLANLPTERAYSFNPLFTINGKVYVGSQAIGASSDFYYFKQLYEYDPQTNLWVKKKDFPGNGRTETTVAVLNNKAYFMFGVGKSGPGQASYQTDAWEYDPSDDSWRQLNSPPATKSGGTGIYNQQAGAIPFVYNNQVYALFGRGPYNNTQTTVYTTLYALNPATGAWDVSFPLNDKGLTNDIIYSAARSGAFSFQYDKWLYFGGGLAASNYNAFGANIPYNTYFNSRQIWGYNVETKELKKVALLPNSFNDCSDPNATGGRMSGFAFIVGNKAYITDCSETQVFVMDLNSSSPTLQATTLRSVIGAKQNGTTGIGIGVGNKAYFGLRNADWWEFTP